MKPALIVIVVLIILGIGYVALTPKSPPASTGSDSQKLDMNVVCNSALAYMTFPNDASAQAFVAECKEGKHPEVIDHYKADMNLGTGAQI